MPTSPGTFYPTNPFLGQKIQGSAVGAREMLRAYPVHFALTAAQAVLGTSADYLSAADNSVAINTSTILAQPTCPRNVVATPGGTTANVTAVSVTVTGTDETGATISEVLPAFSAGAGTAKVGNKAFATITNISCPINGAAVTLSVGPGAKFGIPHKLARNTVPKGCAFLNNVREATEPTVATDASVLCNNTILLNSAPNGTAIDVYYFVP